jgi:chromosome segregation ATPase
MSHTIFPTYLYVTQAYLEEAYESLYQRYKALDLDLTSAQNNLISHQDSVNTLESANRALVHEISDLKRQLEEKGYVKSKVKEQCEELLVLRGKSELSHTAAVKELTDKHEDVLRTMTINHSQV